MKAYIDTIESIEPEGKGSLVRLRHWSGRSCVVSNKLIDHLEKAEGSVVGQEIMWFPVDDPNIILGCVMTGLDPAEVADSFTRAKRIEGREHIPEEGIGITELNQLIEDGKLSLSPLPQES